MFASYLWKRVDITIVVGIPQRSSKWEKLSKVTKIIYISEKCRILATWKEKKKEQFFSGNFSRFRWRRMRAIFWGVVFGIWKMLSLPIHKTIKTKEKPKTIILFEFCDDRKWSLNNQSKNFDFWERYLALGYMDCITTKWLWENWMRGDEKMQNWHNGLASHIRNLLLVHFRFGLLHPLHLLKFCIFFRKYQPI